LIHVALLPTDRPQTVITGVAWRVTEKSILFEALSADKRCWVAQLNFGKARKVQPDVGVSLCFAALEAWSTNAASKRAVSRPALGIDNQPMLLAVPATMVSLTTLKHLAVIQGISELPGVSHTTTIFGEPTKQPIVAPSFFAVLMAVESSLAAEPGLAWTVAQRSNPFLAGWAELDWFSNTTPVRTPPTKGCSQLGHFQLDPIQNLHHLVVGQGTLLLVKDGLFGF